ncbi:potassium channel protein [bacterium]|nr:potassium channel protein [bacterium]MCB9475489.1 potassium channel protein [Deltaproteobacteria bacterium]
MDISRFAKIVVPLSVSLITMGTLGYIVIEDAHWYDALYMTVITISTVGYAETIPLSTAGRMFTMALIFFGTGFMLTMVAMFAEVIIEARIRSILGRRRLARKIQHMHDHIILCGYGRIGQVIAERLQARRVRMVVVEAQEHYTQLLDEFNFTYIHGDATKEHILEQAGIAKARTLIVALSSDADAVFTILLAREMNPNLEIIVRAVDRESDRRLRSAGADRVVSLYDLVGRNMANRILNPEIEDILSVATLGTHEEIRMVGIKAHAPSDLIGRTLREAPIRTDLGLIIIGIKKNHGEMIFNPLPDEKIEAGDVLITMGEEPNLEKLQGWLNPEHVH